MWYSVCRNLYRINNFNWIGGGVMFLGLIAVGIIIYLLFRNKNYKVFQSANETFSAQEILKQRLAKGEIDEDTYNNLKDKISR